MELPEANCVFWEQGRLETFTSWPFKESDKCNPKAMAAAGFYSIGNSNEPDLVECFICGKQLDGWESNDEPWNEHMKHQPNCIFVNLNKQDEKEWTVEEMYNLYKKFKIKEFINELDKNISIIKNKVMGAKNELSSIYKTRKNTKSTS